MVKFGVNLSAVPSDHRRIVSMCLVLPELFASTSGTISKLITKLCHCLHRCQKRYLRTTLGLPNRGRSGDSYSDFWQLRALALNKHFIVAVSLFAVNVVFHVMPKIDILPLAEFFRAEGIKVLLKKGRIEENCTEMFCAGGTSLDSAFIAGHNLRVMIRKCRRRWPGICLRNPFLVEKICYQQYSRMVGLLLLD